MEYFCEPNRPLLLALQGIDVEVAVGATRSVTWDNIARGRLYNDWQKCVPILVRMAYYVLTGIRNRIAGVLPGPMFNLIIPPGVLQVKIRGLFPTHSNLFANGGGGGQEVRRMVMIDAENQTTYLMQLEWNRNVVSH